MKRQSRSQIWIVLAGLVLQILVPLTKYIPGAAGLWHTEDPAKFYSAFGTFFGIQLILMSCTILLLIKSLGNELAEKVEGALPATEVRRMKDYEFYEHFQAAAEQAEHSVRIAYFAPYPPTEVASKGRKKYYDTVLSLMKQRDRVNFKRLVRSSPKNRAWLASLLRELEGRPNVDLAVLTRDLGPEVELPLALSVQVIDKDKVWVVATGSHETQNEFRDVFVQNSDFAAAMTEYYDRVWSVSDRLLDRGRITEQGRQFLTSQDESETKA
jgi:hypothetical protein